MYEVTASNFEQSYSKIENAVSKAVFVSIDCEFSGIKASSDLKVSLFDTVEERYAKLKNNIQPFIAIQLGLTTYQFDRNENKYTAQSFNFYLFPEASPARNALFLWQASSIEFLCSYGFDFNKFAYEGISYLNEPDEAALRNELREQNLLRNLERYVSYKDEDLLKANNSLISDWLEENPSVDDVFYLNTATPMLQYLTQKELRNRFMNIWTSSVERKVSVKKVSEEVRKTLETEDGDNLENALLNSSIGFSKVFKLLVDSKKPIVGHNMLLDIMFMHQQFHKPLPDKYADFKRNIHQMFPRIYDTKFLSFEIKKVLKKEEMWKSNSLNALYKYFKDQKGRHLALNSPLIELEDMLETGEDRFHEAGWDSYCTGYCFIRLAHTFAVKRNGSGYETRPLTSSEMLSGVSGYENCINLIRASTSHLRIDGPDPECTRPQWLHVQSLEGKSINISKIAEMFSTYGAVDVKPFAARQALVAVANHGSARDILTHFRSSGELRVAPYSLLRHSPVVRLVLWSGVLASGSIFAWMVHHNLQKPSLT